MNLQGTAQGVVSVGQTYSSRPATHKDLWYDRVEQLAWFMAGERHPRPQARKGGCKWGGHMWAMPFLEILLLLLIES